MKGAVLYGAHQPLVIEELHLLPPQAGEVRVHFGASGVCHSDLHYIKGDRMCPMPVVLGHEGAGVVEEVGPWRDLCQTGRSRHTVARSGLRTLCRLRRRAAESV